MMRPSLLVLIIVAAAGGPAPALGQSPPPGYNVRARVSTCPPYQPTACQYKAVFLDSRAWCGKHARWWTPTDSRQTVTVSCQ